MEIKEFLEPGAVVNVPLGKKHTKYEVLVSIANLANEIYGIDYENAFNALEEREKASSTGLGQGIALPHARSDQFGRIVGMFIKLDESIEFAAPDRIPVDLIFGIFAPHTNSVDYLKSLSNVARTLRSVDVRRSLRAASDCQEIYSILTGSQLT